MPVIIIHVVRKHTLTNTRTHLLSHSLTRSHRPSEFRDNVRRHLGGAAPAPNAHTHTHKGMRVVRSEQMRFSCTCIRTIVDRREYHDTHVHTRTHKHRPDDVISVANFIYFENSAQRSSLCACVRVRECVYEGWAGRARWRVDSKNTGIATQSSVGIPAHTRAHTIIRFMRSNMLRTHTRTVSGAERSALHNNNNTILSPRPCARH